MFVQPVHSRLAVFRRRPESPVDFRLSLQELGPTFIKIGQFLALRPDLIPQQYCDELMLLLDRVPPFPWEEAQAVIEADLLAKTSELFAYINPRPVAAGSFAQTHFARLPDGAQVAVKVQRPGIRERVLHDLAQTRLLTRMLERSGITAIVSPEELIFELTDGMLRELDLSNELANVSRLYSLAEGSDYQAIPRPYRNLCGTRVITYSYLRGIAFSDLLSELRQTTTYAQERAIMPEVDRNQLAINLITASLTQIFRYQFFHADPHPGNLLAMPNNVVGFVDFGLCDELDDLIRNRQMRYLAAIFSRDPAQMFSALTEVFVPTSETDINAFRRDFTAETRSPAAGRRNGDGGARNGRVRDIERSPISRSLIGVMRAARRHRLRVAPRVLALYRTLLAVETVASELGTDVDLWSVGRSFFTDLQIDEASRLFEPENAQAIALNLLSLGRDAPGQLHQILTELSDGRFVLNVYTTEASKTMSDRNRRVRLLVTAILSITVALLLSRPQLPAPFGISLAWPLLVILLALYVSIFLQWRRLR